MFGTYATAGSTHALFDGVDELFYFNGNSVADLVAGDDAEVILTVEGYGAFGVYGDAAPPVVPEPATMTLLGLGITGIAARRRFRKQ